MPTKSIREFRRLQKQKTLEQFEKAFGKGQAEKDLIAIKERRNRGRPLYSDFGYPIINSWEHDESEKLDLSQCEMPKPYVEEDEDKK